MSKYFWGFVATSIILLSVSFYFHLGYISVEDKSIMIQSYSVNFILGVIVFIAIELFKKKHTNILGFIFLGGSLFKFLVYFIYLLPLLTSTGELTKFKFLVFYIPYFICLMIELLFLVRLMNNETK
jgi:fumarate reductase subunit D